MDDTVFPRKFFGTGAVQFGEFTLKSGKKSNVYLDLRRASSVPDVLCGMCERMIGRIPEEAKFDIVCGVPTAGVPFATEISRMTGKPSIMVRKEPKGHGMGKQIEGIYNPGCRCLVIDDLITNGKSKQEIIDILEFHGIQVIGILVFIDRTQGGERIISIPVYHCYTLEEILASRRGSISPFKQRLIEVSNTKKSRLIASLDVKTSEELIQLIHGIACYVCAVKIHSDAICDFNVSTVFHLNNIKKEYSVLLIEDRKFADIGSVTEQQLTNGPTCISHWADMVTVHGLFGSSTLEGFRNTNIGAILLAHASVVDFEGMVSPNYADKVADLADKYSDRVAGFICQKYVAPEYLHFTPGISMNRQNDSMGQRYRTPEVAFSSGTDFLIVGRDIYNSEEPVKKAKELAEISWNAYNGSRL